MLRKRIFILLITSTALLSLSYLKISFQDWKMIYSGLKIARAAIDTEKVRFVNQNLHLGFSLVATDEYQLLVGKLNQITEAFPLKAKWSYISSKGNSLNTATLTVLTISPSPGDVTTFPGYLYDISKYPSMKKAIYGEDDIVISGIVWDKTYKILTRSGFIKLKDSSGLVLGVLGVDITMEAVLLQLIEIVVFTVLIALASLLILFNLMLPPRPKHKGKKNA
jgi:hypothetical protein